MKLGSDEIVAATPTPVIAAPSPAAPAKLPKAIAPTPVAAKPPTLEPRERRRLGDAVKAQIVCQKYAIDANCHASVAMPLATFKANVAPHAARIIPADFSALSPVVVARIEGAEKAGDAFGYSKITGGNRMQQWSASCCDVVFYPLEGRADLWWVMR